MDLNLELSDPRKEAEVRDWPSGKRRVTALFRVEVSENWGERVSRITTKLDSVPESYGKPRRTAYHKKIRIVNGNDGRIYLLGLTDFRQIVVISGTLNKTEYLHANEANPQFQVRYERLKVLLVAAN